MEAPVSAILRFTGDEHFPAGLRGCRPGFFRIGLPHGLAWTWESGETLSR